MRPRLYELYTPMTYAYTVYEGTSEGTNHPLTDAAPSLEGGTNQLAVLPVDDPTLVSSDIRQATNVVLATSTNEGMAYTAHKICLTDKKDYFAPGDIKAATSIYSRSNTAGYNSVCLPFAIRADQVETLFGVGAKVMQFTGVEYVDGNLTSLTFSHLTGEEQIAAGVPCLVKCIKDTPWEIQLPDASLCGTAGTQPSAQATLVGSFQKQTLGEGYYKLNAEGTGFVATSSSSTVTPFRVYMQLKGEQPARLQIPAFNDEPLLDETATQTGSSLSVHPTQIVSSPTAHPLRPAYSEAMKENFRRGDVDGDGLVDTQDVTLLEQVIAQRADVTTLLTDGGLSDINLDGKVDIQDVTHLIYILKGGKQESHEYVDLGLPSGTLWATINVGATQPGEPGYYLSWGELQPKDDYRTATLLDATGSAQTERTSIIGTKHDAATVYWGAEWQMPTRAQLEELRDHCTWTPAVVDGVSGMRVSGKAEGYTDRSIFLPFTGYRHDTRCSLQGSYGFLWAGDQYINGSLADGFGYTDGGQGAFRSYYQRVNGRCIRPVRCMSTSR